MRQRVIKANSHDDLGRKSLRQILVGSGKNRRATAEQNELHFSRQHFFQRAELDIDSFLFDQAGDVAEQRNVRVLRQAKFALQRQFARAFSFQVLEGIGLRE